MLKIKLQEMYYWNVQRKTQHFVPWVARKLPAKLKYYVVVHGAVSVEKDGDPSGVTALQMMDFWSQP